MFVWRFTRRSGSLFSLRGTAGGKRRGFSGLSRDTIAKMCRCVEQAQAGPRCTRRGSLRVPKPPNVSHIGSDGLLGLAPLGKWSGPILPGPTCGLSEGLRVGLVDGS